MQKTKIKFLVNIDTIFDVVYGAVKLTHPRSVHKLDSKKYYFRLHERLDELFPGINHNAYNNVILNNDPELLKNSPVTQVLDEISNIMDRSIRVDDDHPDKIHEFHLDLNLQNYPFSAEEKHTLGKILTNVCGITKLCFCRIPYKKLTPKLLRKKYNCVVIRNLMKWEEFNLERLKETPCTSVTMVAPITMVKGDYEDFKSKDIAENYIKLYSPFMELELLPLAKMSKVMPAYEEDYKPPSEEDISEIVENLTDVKKGEH